MKQNDNLAIEVEHVNKSFKIYYDKAHTLKEHLLFWKRNESELFVALKDINVSIKKGETVGLIGVNGSGKSTLLKLMTKIIYPTKGKNAYTGILGAFTGVFINRTPRNCKSGTWGHFFLSAKQTNK